MTREEATIKVYSYMSYRIEASIDEAKEAFQNGDYVRYNRAHSEYKIALRAFSNFLQSVDDETSDMFTRWANKEKPLIFPAYTVKEFFDNSPAFASVNQMIAERTAQKTVVAFSDGSTVEYEDVPF